MTAIKARGESPFDEAGDGIVLRFTNRDLKELATLEEIGGDNFMPYLTNLTLEGNIPIALLETLARKGAKKDGVPAEIADEVFDKIVIADLAEKVFDALYMSVHGKKFGQYIEDAAKAMKDAQAEGRLPQQFRPDTTGSTISANAPSGPESELKSSGESAPAKHLNS